MFGKTSILDEKVWAATYSSWEEEALSLGEEGFFIADDITSRLDHKKSLVEKEENVHAYFITKSDSEDNVAYALINVAHAQAKSSKPWLKLLDITLRPSLLPSNDSELDKMKEAVGVLGYSMVNALELTYDEHPATTLKIYGRTSEMRDLFKVMLGASILDESLENASFDAKVEGNWLVLSKKMEG